MRHTKCWYAVLGVVAIPAVAAACWPMWGGRQQARNSQPVYATPNYATPMYAYPPVYVNPPAWQNPQPMPQPKNPALPPPRVEMGPKLATPVAAPPTTAIEPVRPVSGSDTPPKLDPPKLDPLKLDPPKTDQPKIELPKVDPPKIDVPKVDPAKVEPPPFPPDLSFPKIDIPKNLQIEPKAKVPDMGPAPKVPAVGAPKDPFLPAIPSAAPPPDALIPPPSIPMMPDPKQRNPLPSLTLPPDTPVAPPSKSDSTSRSSPISGTTNERELSVNVFAASRDMKPVGIYRTIGFFNHTDRDLALTIEGRSVKLPARSYLHAQLASTFTWGYAARPAARETVPEGSAGIDVVFRE